MRWSQEQYLEYLQRRAAGDQRVCSAEPEPGAPVPLVGPLPGKDQSRSRAKIRFTVYATRPADFDNIRVKEILDCLVHAGILDGDSWDVLQGEVISCKAASKAEEKTTIEITYG